MLSYAGDDLLNKPVGSSPSLAQYSFAHELFCGPVEDVDAILVRLYDFLKALGHFGVLAFGNFPFKDAILYPVQVAA